MSFPNFLLIGNRSVFFSTRICIPVGNKPTSTKTTSLTLEIHPWRLTWNIIMEVWKIIFLSKWVICMFHVNLPGCKLQKGFVNINMLCNHHRTGMQQGFYWWMFPCWKTSTEKGWFFPLWAPSPWKFIFTHLNKRHTANLEICKLYLSQKQTVQWHFAPRRVDTSTHSK